MTSCSVTIIDRDLNISVITRHHDGFFDTLSHEIRVAIICLKDETMKHGRLMTSKELAESICKTSDTWQVWSKTKRKTLSGINNHFMLIFIEPAWLLIAPGQHQIVS